MTVYYLLYDPITGAWKQSSRSRPALNVANPINSGGMIAWSADQAVYCVTYDPRIRSWTWTNSLPGSYIADLEVSTGVAAWLAGNQAYFVIYDVERSAWRPGAGGGGFVSSVAVANSSVSWVAGTPGVT